MIVINRSAYGTLWRRFTRFGLAVGLCLGVAGSIVGSSSAFAEMKTLDLTCDETSCTWKEKIKNNSTYTFVIVCDPGTFKTGGCSPGDAYVDCDDEGGADSLTCACANSSFTDHYANITAYCNE